MGFKCTCPRSKVLLFDGACESRFSVCVFAHFCQSFSTTLLKLVVDAFASNSALCWFCCDIAPQIRGSCTPQ